MTTRQPGANPANTGSGEPRRKGKMENKRALAIAMAERLEKLANGLESLGMNKEARVNRAKASEIRKANQ